MDQISGWDIIRQDPGKDIRRDLLLTVGKDGAAGFQGVAFPAEGAENVVAEFYRKKCVIRRLPLQKALPVQGNAWRKDGKTGMQGPDQLLSFRRGAVRKSGYAGLSSQNPAFSFHDSPQPVP